MFILLFFTRTNRPILNIGFIVNCCLDNATPPINHVYGAGYLRKNSFYGDSIRLYDAPRGGNVIFTGLCDDIFELHFPQFSFYGIAWFWIMFYHRI